MTIVNFPRYRMRHFYSAIDNYFLVKESQGTIAAATYIKRIVPIQLRNQVFTMIEEATKNRSKNG